MKFIVDFVVSYANKGKWWALAIGTVLFGATWMLGLVWPGNPLTETWSGIKTGVEAAYVSPTSIE